MSRNSCARRPFGEKPCPTTPSNPSPDAEHLPISHLISYYGSRSRDLTVVAPWIDGIHTVPARCRVNVLRGASADAVLLTHLGDTMRGYYQPAQCNSYIVIGTACLHPRIALVHEINLIMTAGRESYRTNIQSGTLPVELAPSRGAERTISGASGDASASPSSGVTSQPTPQQCREPFVLARAICPLLRTICRANLRRRMSG